MELIHQVGKSVIFILLFSLYSATNPVLGQARRTATRSAEYDIFGGFSYVKSDYLPPDQNYGVTIGADYTQFVPRYHGLITPSFEVRGTSAPGPEVGEKTFEAGFRVTSTYRRLHPYVDLLVGGGLITFDHPLLTPRNTLYKSDSSFIYVYGGGLMLDAKRDFSAVVDFQQQYWDLGQQPPVRFYPGALTFGVVYHIPFKPYKTR